MKRIIEGGCDLITPLLPFIVLGVFNLGLFLSSGVLQTEMESFWDIFINGEGKWLFAIIFLGIGFLIAWKIRAFNLVMMGATLFMAVHYLAITPFSTELMWYSLIYWIAMAVFTYKLFGMDLFG